MSEIMLAVLGMPDDLFWADDPMNRHQHNQVRKEAAREIRESRARIAELEAENHALLARAAVLVDALELARGEIAHYFKEIRHLGGSWEVKRVLDRVDQVLDAYPRHGDAQPQEPGNE